MKTGLADENQREKMNKRERKSKKKRLLPLRVEGKDYKIEGRKGLRRGN